MARKKFQWSREGEDTEGELHFTERDNRSERKREADRLDALVKQLIRLKPDQIDRLMLSEPVLAAVAEAQRIKAKGRVRSGMRRQMLFVAGVLRHEEEEEITRIIEAAEKMARKSG
jgi:ribosomal 50S subunit-associated protein YjgA (DUF615 family)